MEIFLTVAQFTLVALGGVLLLLASRRWRAIPRNMRFHVLFRRTLFGLVPLLTGIGWYMGWPALVAAALIVGFGEMFETSLDIAALDAGNHGRSPFPRQ